MITRDERDTMAAMAFVKLDTGILNSTLWIERDQREVFITALLMAEPREFETPIPQIQVGELEFTGFEVPPGWYGFVPAASVGIIRRAGVEMESGMEALRRMGEADIESRSKDFEGRRMIRIDGGFLILNFMKYRDKDHTAALRQQRLRDRRKALRGVTDELPSVTRDVQESRRDVALPERNITQADSRVQIADPKKTNTKKPDSPIRTSEAEKGSTVAPDSVDTRCLSESVGIFGMKEQANMHALLAVHVKDSDRTVQGSIEHMVSRWNEYQAQPELEWRYGSSYKFFMSGNWDKPEAWPRKEKSRSARIAAWSAKDDNETA